MAAAEVLAKRQPLAIVSSDLTCRAYDTAVTLADCSEVEVRVDKRLRKPTWGLAGLTHQQVDAIAPGARQIWREDATCAPHGGRAESMSPTAVFRWWPNWSPVRRAGGLMIATGRWCW